MNREFKYERSPKEPAETHYNKPALVDPGVVTRLPFPTFTSAKPVVRIPPRKKSPFFSAFEDYVILQIEKNTQFDLAQVASVLHRPEEGLEARLKALKNYSDAFIQAFETKVQKDPLAATRIWLEVTQTETREHHIPPSEQAFIDYRLIDYQFLESVLVELPGDMFVEEREFDFMDRNPKSRYLKLAHPKS